MNKAELRQFVFLRDSYHCQYPGCQVIGINRLELAHRIANTEANYKWAVRLIFDWFGKNISVSQAKIIINQPGNLRASCRIHNDYFNIGFKRSEAEGLIKQLWQDFNNENI